MYSVLELLTSCGELEKHQELCNKSAHVPHSNACAATDTLHRVNFSFAASLLLFLSNGSDFCSGGHPDGECDGASLTQATAVAPGNTGPGTPYQEFSSSIDITACYKKG